MQNSHKPNLPWHKYNTLMWNPRICLISSIPLSKVYRLMFLVTSVKDSNANARLWFINNLDLYFKACNNNLLRILHFLLFVLNKVETTCYIGFQLVWNVISYKWWALSFWNANLNNIDVLANYKAFWN
jgi:hypothetical protein